MRESMQDYAPLYSSMNKDKIFVPPKTAKELLQKRHQKLAEKDKNWKWTNNSTVHKTTAVLDVDLD